MIFKTQRQADNCIFHWHEGTRPPVGESGDLLDYDREKRHKVFEIRPDTSKKWKLLDINVELNLQTGMGIEDGQALYPIDTQRYYDSSNVLSTAMRKHLKEGLRGFNDEHWSVKLLSGYSV